MVSHKGSCQSRTSSTPYPTAPLAPGIKCRGGKEQRFANRVRRLAATVFESADGELNAVPPEYIETLGRRGRRFVCFAESYFRLPCDDGGASGVLPRYVETARWLTMRNQGRPQPHRYVLPARHETLT